MDFEKKKPGVLKQNSLVLSFGRCLQKELEQPKGNSNSVYIDCWWTTVGRTRPPAGAAQVLRWRQQQELHLAETTLVNKGESAPLELRPLFELKSLLDSQDHRQCSA